MNKSTSEEENYAKTLLCIQRKRELVNIHDKEIKPAPGGKGRYNKVATGVRTTTLDPILLCKTNAIEVLPAPGLPLLENLYLIKVDQLLGWRW